MHRAVEAATYARKYCVGTLEGIEIKVRYLRRGTLCGDTDDIILNSHSGLSCETAACLIFLGSQSVLLSWVYPIPTSTDHHLGDHHRHESFLLLLSSRVIGKRNELSDSRDSKSIAR